MSKYLPDTDLAAVTIGKDVYTYAQTFDGVLRECLGRLKTVRNRDDVYSYQLMSHVIARYEDEEVAPDAPRLFTPLAASNIDRIRYLFYVDDKNTLRDVKSTAVPWQDGGLGGLNIQCAYYSKLTAITIFRNNFQAICVFYQSPDSDAGIEMVSFSTKNSRWVKGEPDMEPNPPPPPPPPRVVDPPLYGTSLSAVRPRKDIEVVPGSPLPVVYLQWDNLGLAHSQKNKVKVISTIDQRFAPHTSLAVVDDGSKLYCFYTSSRNNHIKMITLENGNSKVSDPIELETPTPRSAIAAVLTNKRIVLFYQSLNAEAGVVELNGATYAIPLTASTGTLVPYHTTKLGTS